MIRSLCLFALALTGLVTQAQKTQSAIYDAVTIMNVKYGLNALLLPKGRGFDLINPIDQSRQAITGDIPDGFKKAANSEAAIIAILRRVAGLDNTASDEMVMAAYEHNPFLFNILTDTPRDLQKKAALFSSIEAYEFARTSGSIGQDILGNLVNGTADFLIKRAQEEISISVFEKLKGILEKYPEFNTLFPSTCELIKPVNPYEYHKALVAFKSAVNYDLQNFVSRVALLYDLPRYKILNQKVPALTLLFGATTVYDKLGDQNFAGTMCTLGKQPYLGEQNNYAGVIKVSTIVSNSLLDKTLADDETKPAAYINKDFISLATHNDLVLLGYLSKIYLGLIWQQTQNIRFTTGAQSETFAALLTHWSDTHSVISEALAGINQTLAGIQNIDDQLKKIKDDEKGVQLGSGKNGVNVKHYVLATELVNNSLSLVNIFIDESKPDVKIRIEELQKQWPSFAASVSDMAMNFQAGEYNLAISNFATVLTVLSDYLEAVQNDKDASAALLSSVQSALDTRLTNLTQSKSDLENKLKALPRPTGDAEKDVNIEAQRQEIKAAIAQINNELKSVRYEKDNSEKFVYSLKRIIRCADLLASVSKAENSAAVEQLLEAYALPAGSSRVKKIATFNISLNAYVGGFFERKNQDGEGFTNTYGLTAPIGIALSTGFQKAGSLSLFFGAFDIGGTIRYKLDNQGHYQQNVSLAGIVSPSIQLVYGFPFYLPLSAGLGCQWVSPVTEESNKIHLRPGFNAFIGVDIPLFNLKTNKDFK
jgi:hypothetical protein